MAFVYTDQRHTKRCKGCGKVKGGSFKKGSVLCNDCIRLERIKHKPKK